MNEINRQFDRRSSNNQQKDLFVSFTGTRWEKC